MRTVKQLLEERPKVLGIVIFVIAFLPLALLLHRFLLQCFVLAMFLSLIGISSSKKVFPVICYNICVLLCIVSLVCPLDLAIRNSDGWHLKCVRILWVFQRASTDRIVKEEQLLENIDYVAYDGPKMFLGPRWAVLITIPVQSRLKTPFF
jgi:hypothetical protein